MSKYENIFDTIIHQYTYEEIEQICKVLNRVYNVYDSDAHRWTQLHNILGKTPQKDLAALQSEQCSNRIINDLIFRFYPCERVVKYYLIKKLLSLRNHIVAFEMSIGNSRIDLCRINGHSYAYEIKTAYDSFDRLETQMYDYMATFEKVYLVVPFELRCRAATCIPQNCGIISYKPSQNGELRFSYFRKATLNTCDVKRCVESLSSADLSQLLKLFGITDIPNLRSEKLTALFPLCGKSFFATYRKLLTEKYSEKWNFLVEHFEEILPIDIQNFFSTTLDPHLVYPQKSAE